MWKAAVYSQLTLLVAARDVLLTSDLLLNAHLGGWVGVDSWRWCIQILFEKSVIISARQKWSGVPDGDAVVSSIA